jgi:hypothetical protein
LKRLRLRRDEYSGPSTTGLLHFDDHVLHTLERPWLPTDPGGRPNESCVPAGHYQLINHKRPNGDDVVALVNHGLGVYYLPDERPNGVGRSLILIHVANYVHQIVGCIAPGMGATVTDQGRMVTSSRQAMGILMDWIDGDDVDLIIEEQV